MDRWFKISLGLVVWLAFWLRLAGLFANSFHADEALFAGWARHIAVWRDPLLLTQAVDKPPLLFYLQALFYPLQGPVTWAARLPNFIASIWLVPLTAVLFWQLYRERWGMLGTAVVVACSPLSIQFSATAFTDPLLTFWLVAALVVMCRSSTAGGTQAGSRGWLFGGLLFGLAVATKYQAWLFLPLLGGLGWLKPLRRRDWAAWGLGLWAVLVLIFVWEYARTQSFTLVAAQVSNYGGLRPAWSWEWSPRWREWWALSQTIMPLALLLPVGGALVVLPVRSWLKEGRAEAVDLLLILFLLTYLGLHWLLAVPVWDRYLLPLVPLIALLVGRMIMLLARWRLTIGKRVLPLTAVACLGLFGLYLAPALNARQGQYTVGGQPAADQGAALIADYLAEAPYGTVLYDHWYSWQWRYHLFDKAVHVSWFPGAVALQRELLAFGRDGQAHYLALPNSDVSLPIVRAVEEVGFALQPVANEGNIMLFQILPVEVSGDK